MLISKMMSDAPPGQDVSITCTLSLTSSDIYRLVILANEQERIMQYHEADEMAAANGVLNFADNAKYNMYLLRKIVDAATGTTWR